MTWLKKLLGLQCNHSFYCKDEVEYPLYNWHCYSCSKKVVATHKDMNPENPYAQEAFDQMRYYIEGKTGVTNTKLRSVE